MNIYENIVLLKAKNVPFVLVTVVTVSGSSPGKSGFKLLYVGDQEIYGTVGGGEIEAEAVRHCRICMVEQRNDLVEYLLSSSGKPDNPRIKQVPMKCNGMMTLFYETFNSAPQVYVFGGGHVGQALLYYLKPLSFHSTLIDNRLVFADKTKNPDADKIIHRDYLEYAGDFQPGKDSYIAVLTHGHEYDYDIARIIYARKLDFKYLGIIASKKKAQDIRQKLIMEFGENISFDHFHSPIGLDTGGDSASEIALSISAEMQKTRFQAD